MRNASILGIESNGLEASTRVVRLLRGWFPSALGLMLASPRLHGMRWISFIEENADFPLRFPMH